MACVKRCKECRHYRNESYTPTGIGIADCGIKESRRYGKMDGSIMTVVYENQSCRYFERNNPYYQQTFEGLVMI